MTLNVDTFRRPLSQRCTRLIGLLLAIAAPVAHADPDLIWSDEFDGDTLDLDKWVYEFGTGAQYGLQGWGNNELQYYTSRTQNASISDGVLSITARRENFNGNSYTSARIRTFGNFSFTYGRVEARLKLPKGQGYWPAFWMLPDNSPYGTWAASGEIDIMEAVNQVSTLHGTIHYGGEWPSNTSAGSQLSVGDLSDDFHTFALEWEPGRLTWFYDGTQFGSYTDSRWFSSNSGGDSRAPFNVPFHMILNVAVGGNWPGSPNAATVFPQSLEVDWVRVYRQQQEGFSGSPTPIPARIQAENFDLGYPGEAYSDSDYGNNGNQYRDTDVDIEASSGGGFNIGWIDGDDWLEYTVDVAEAGTYQVIARVASNESAGGAFDIELDGQVLASFDAPFTGGWQNWTTASALVPLEAGVQTLRMQSTGSAAQGFNLDWIEFVFDSPDCSFADLASPSGVSAIDVITFVVSEDDFNNDGRSDAVDLFDWLNAIGPCIDE